jgi:preprotein translocase subunit SecD
MDTRQFRTLIVILVVLVVALLNPLYRHSKKMDIITLGLDLKGGADILLRAAPPAGQQVTSDQMAGAIEVVRRRIDPNGVRELILQQVGPDRITLQVPGVKDKAEKPEDLTVEKIVKLLGSTALLEFIDVGATAIPDGTDTTNSTYPIVIKGDDLAKADVQFNLGRPVVSFQLKTAAADKFGSFTGEHVNQFMAIVLDKKVISCPVIKNAIWGGSGQIEGNFTIDDASMLARELNAGRLPVPLEILETRVVGPTLGIESIKYSVRAGLWGFLLVLAFMLLIYKLPGFVADIALALYVVFVLGYLSLFNATLTLPGIAGFILSIGMAVDTNVIIFERLKEEIAWGKTLHAALESAYARAFVAVFDSHMTTIIGGAVLYFYGTGPVKGFAVTLLLGVAISLFSAVTVTRFILNTFATYYRNIRLYV